MFFSEKKEKDTKYLLAQSIFYAPYVMNAWFDIMKRDVLFSKEIIRSCWSGGFSIEGLVLRNESLEFSVLRKILSSSSCQFLLCKSCASRSNGSPCKQVCRQRHGFSLRKT